MYYSYWLQGKWVAPSKMELSQAAKRYPAFAICFSICANEDVSETHVVQHNDYTYHGNSFIIVARCA